MKSSRDQHVFTRSIRQKDVTLTKPQEARVFGFQIESLFIDHNDITFKPSNLLLHKNGHSKRRSRIIHKGSDND